MAQLRLGFQEKLPQKQKGKDFQTLRFVLGYS